MNFATYYYQRARTDLASKVFELYCREELIPGKDNPYSDRLDRFSHFYKEYLIGFEKRMSNTNKVLLELLHRPAHPVTISIVYRQIMLVLWYIIENELYEMLPKFYKTNLKIAEEIARFRPDMDVRPLLSEKNFREFIHDFHGIVSDYRKKTHQK